MRRDGRRRSRAACPPAGAGATIRQPSGCGFARKNHASGAKRASTASPAASERIRNAGGAARLVISTPLQFERADSPRRGGSGVQATGREWRKESAQVIARSGRRCRDGSLRQGAILANGRARTTSRQRRPLAREPSRLRPQRTDWSRDRSGSPGVANPLARASKFRREPASCDPTFDQNCGMRFVVSSCSRESVSL